MYMNKSKKIKWWKRENTLLAEKNGFENLIFWV